MKNEAIQNLKQSILTYNDAYVGRMMTNNFDAQEGVNVIMAAKGMVDGFAAKLIDSVTKYKKVSEKQAYCIARAIIDQYGSFEEMQSKALRG